MANTMNDVDKVSAVAGEMSQLCEISLLSKLTQMKMAGMGDAPQHAYVVAVAASTVINILGKILTMPTDESKVDEWSSSPASRSAVLLACLLVARCAKPEFGGINFEFGPSNILAALEAIEQVLGRNCDLEFSKPMVKAARMFPKPTHFFDNSTSSSVVDLNKLRTLN